MIGHFLYSNSSLFAILLAALAVFVWGSLVQKANKLFLLRKVVFLLFVPAFVACILFTQGRAGFIGSVAGLLFIYRDHFSFPLKKRSLFLAGSLFILLLAGGLFWVKRDSSYGRLLIYKVSASLFKTNWLWGTGYGNFKQQYNLAQAAHFAENDINGPEALLADNTFYAFNDGWQLLIELGLLRFIVLLALLSAIGVLMTRSFIQTEIPPLQRGAISALICLFIASLFSYPFQVFGVQLVALVLVLAVLFSVRPAPGSIDKRLLIGVRLLVCAFILALCVGAYNKVSNLVKSEAASDLSRAGFKTEASKTYASAYKPGRNSGPFLLAYARQLYYANRLPEAMNLVEEAKTRYTENDLYTLSAAIRLETGDTAEAEKDYKTALYMVPNRMRSRYDLMQFYLLTKDTSTAVYSARSILYMPVKIPSATTKNLQNQTKKLLKSLGSTSSKL